jgi:hypothetical protein
LALSGVVGSLARWCSSEEEVVVGVEQWAEIRRLYFVKRLSINAFSYERIAAGAHDAFIRRWATAARGYRRRILLRFDPWR